jgi:hypothetical protein
MSPNHIVASFAEQYFHTGKHHTHLYAAKDPVFFRNTDAAPKLHSRIILLLSEKQTLTSNMIKPVAFSMNAH